MSGLETKVIQQLRTLNEKYSTLKLGAAVSGGADSICLLAALSEILKDSNNPLKVITINHNIRPVEETSGDAAFVVQFCRELKENGRNVECQVVELPRGLVEETSRTRQGGIEEAARFLRYQAFSKFVSDNQLDYLCLAHNQNDQLETMLMRFLNGSSVEALAGIKAKRDCFARPLIDVARSEIEEYLTEKGYGWRTDSTNLQTEYERNKIRLKLIPFLAENFPGWSNALQSARLRYESDGELINALVDEVEIKQSDKGMTIDKKEFQKLHESLQTRVLLKTCNLAGDSGRIPYEFLKDFIKSANKNWENQFSKVFSTIEISLKKDVVLVKNINNTNTDLIFFGIIEESGLFYFPFGRIKVSASENNQKNCISILKAGEDCLKEQFLFETELPLIIRNLRLDDVVLDAEGDNRKVADIFSDWHVSSEDKSLIPVFQQLNAADQNIKCIAGSFLGYKDWIVKI